MLYPAAFWPLTMSGWLVYQLNYYRMEMGGVEPPSELDWPRRAWAILDLNQ
jgi:hypothetical protein